MFVGYPAVCFFYYLFSVQYQKSSKLLHWEFIQHLRWDMQFLKPGFLKPDLNILFRFFIKNVFFLFTQSFSAFGWISFQYSPIFILIPLQGFLPWHPEIIDYCWPENMNSSLKLIGIGLEFSFSAFSFDCIPPGITSEWLSM